MDASWSEKASSRSSLTQSGRQKMAEDSPTDRVERLLRKYKTRQAVKKTTSSDKVPKQLLSEVLSWKALTIELKRVVPIHSECGNVTISATPTATDCLHLDVSSSIVLRRLIRHLLEQLKQKEASNQDRHVSTTFRTTSPLATPTKTQRPIKSHGAGHMTTVAEADPLVAKLQSQVARLEYENAKLRLDLQNRPEIHDLEVCQERIRELEGELHQSRRILSSEQLDSLQSQLAIENVSTVLGVTKAENIAPKLHTILEQNDTHQRLEKHLSKILEVVYNPTAPKWACQGDFPSKCHRPMEHHIWCEVTWEHVTHTLQEWLSHLQGLQELNLVFSEMCHHLDLSSPPFTVSTRQSRSSKQKRPSSFSQVPFQEPMSNRVPFPRPTSTKGITHVGDNDEVSGHGVGEERREEEESRLVREKLIARRKESDMMNAQEMAEILRHWLLDKGHLKHAWVQSVLAMIRHFQLLFDVPHLDGVYTAMSRLYQQTEHSKNIFKRLKTSLRLDADCSSHELLSAVEYLTSQDNGHLLLQIKSKFGEMEVAEVMRKLRLCTEFFPAFHAMVTELQQFLGVSGISEITSAIYNL